MYRDEEILYCMEELERNVNRPYYLGNEPLANKLFTLAKKKHPGAVMVKREGEQVILTTKRAEKEEMRSLLEKQDKALKRAAELLEEIRRLQDLMKK